MSTTDKSQIVSAIKEWASPTLIVIVGMLLYRDVTELRTDVKTLLSQSYVDKTRIDNLEKRMNQLEQKIYIQTTHIPNSLPADNSERQPIRDSVMTAIVLRSEKHKKTNPLRTIPKTTV